MTLRRSHLNSRDAFGRHRQAGKVRFRPIADIARWDPWARRGRRGAPLLDPRADSAGRQVSLPVWLSTHTNSFCNLTAVTTGGDSCCRSRSSIYGSANHRIWVLPSHVHVHAQGMAENGKQGISDAGHHCRSQRNPFLHPEVWSLVIPGRQHHHSRREPCLDFLVARTCWRRSVVVAQQAAKRGKKQQRPWLVGHG